ncbi:MAG: hypothetical protein WAP55_00900 [Minisyncoccia bacterium]
MQETIKKIISVGVLISILGFYFAAPFTVKKADAILGVADQSFDITIGDIPRLLFQIGEKVLKYGLEKLKKRMLTQIQNDLVNWVQNGGEPRFIKDPGKFLKDNVDATAAKEIDKFFLSKNINICSPFKANVRFLVSKPLLLKEDSVRCSLGDMVGNLENFAQNFQDGSWTAWLKLHETRNTLPGSYLAATELIGAKVAQSGNTAQATISAGKGFLDQKLCSQTKTPKYNLSFVISQGPNTGNIEEVEITDPVIIQQILDETNKEVYSWASIWPLSNPGIFMVEADSIEFTNTGEFKTEDHLPPIKKYHSLTTCSKEETITPGSIVGDQISGLLEKTGIDNIINAKELAQILDAVIDAAVNRAAREGLSYMKSGRGSYTSPLNPRTAKQKNQDLSGLESAEAISLQNQLTDLRNSSSRLELETKKLSGKTNKLADFNKRLDFIAGKYEGGNYVESELLKKTIRGKDSDKKFSDVADRFFSKHNSALTRENEDDRLGITLPPEGSNFNKEENMPGLYLANQAINIKLADIWQAISTVFNNLSPATAYDTKKFCKEIQYILEPEVAGGIDTLPFTNSDGVSIPWSSSDQSYVTKMENITTTFISVDNTRQYMSAEANNTALKSQEYRQIAASYESLTENVEGIISELESDGEFVKSHLPSILMYTSILMDYDRVGRNHGLVQKIKTHTELLSSKNKTLRIPQDDDTVLVLTGKEAEEGAYNDLISARRKTMDEWLSQAEAAARADSGNTNLRIKADAVRNAKSLIVSSWEPNLDEPIPTDTDGKSILDTSNLGIKAYDAVAEVMNLDIETVRSEMEERQQRLGRQQTDVSNRLGKFIEDSQLRKQTGLEGGDSEWEKHFKNRMQLVYAAHIYDFYKNRLLADRGGTADNFCRREVP